MCLEVARGGWLFCQGPQSGSADRQAKDSVITSSIESVASITEFGASGGETVQIKAR